MPCCRQTTHRLMIAALTHMPVSATIPTAHTLLLAPPPSPTRLLDALVQLAQLVCAGWLIHQGQLCDEAVDAGQEAVHSLNTLGGPHLHPAGRQAGQAGIHTDGGLLVEKG